MAKINEDIARLVEKSINHSLNINALKTSFLIFGQTNIKSVVLNNIEINIDGQNSISPKQAKKLSLIFDTNLRSKSYVNNCIRLAHINLKLIYNNRHYFNKKVIA